MNTKNLFTFAGVTYAWYAIVLLVLPDGVFEALYGSTAALDSIAADFLGGSLLGLAVMCLMVRSQPMGTATSAILIGITVDNLHALYVHVSTLIGAEVIMAADWVDLSVSLVVGVGGAYLFMQSRKDTSTET